MPGRAPTSRSSEDVRPTQQDDEEEDEEDVASDVPPPRATCRRTLSRQSATSATGSIEEVGNNYFIEVFNQFKRYHFAIFFFRRKHILNMLFTFMLII